jgi:hypothetical protein
MKKAVLILAAAAVLATTQAYAVTQVIDTDASGNFSLAEIQGVFSNVSARTFTDSDTNHDGYLSQAELTAAQDRGVVPDGMNGGDAGKH